jgi:hypothetical protein
LILIFLFLISKEARVRITIFPDLFLPAFHFEPKDKWFILL